MVKITQSPYRGSSLEEFHQEQMKNLEYRKEYQRLQLQRKVAKLIIEKRQEKQLTQQELANRVKTKQAVISRIESGNVSVGVQMLQRIAQALGSEIEIVFR